MLSVRSITYFPDMSCTSLWNYFRSYPFELEDNPWFPRRWRGYMTDYLRALWEHAGVYDCVIPLLGKALAEAGSNRILDLCSGSGGPVVGMQRKLEAVLGRKITLTLSDKFEFETPAGEHERLILDAAAVPPALRGFRTLFTSFHHFDHTTARRILKSAAEGGDGIGIFEVTNRRLLTFILVLYTPFHVLLFTPLIRPISLPRLFWTYVIPLVPAAATWDGLISNLRSYSCRELLLLTEGLDAFLWQTGSLSSRLGVRVTYLVGTKRRPPSGCGGNSTVSS